MKISWVADPKLRIAPVCFGARNASSESEDRRPNRRSEVVHAPALVFDQDVKLSEAHSICKVPERETQVRDVASINCRRYGNENIFRFYK